jgi:hypothetical protein
MVAALTPAVAVMLVRVPAQVPVSVPADRPAATVPAKAAPEPA